MFGAQVWWFRPSFSPNNQETEVGKSLRVRDQSGLHTKSPISQDSKERACLLKKIFFSNEVIKHALVCVCVGGGQWSEDNLWELILSFNHIDPRDASEESRLGNKYPWCYLASHVFYLCMSPHTGPDIYWSSDFSSSCL